MEYLLSFICLILPNLLFSQLLNIRIHLSIYEVSGLNSSGINPIEIQTTKEQIYKTKFMLCFNCSQIYALLLIFNKTF
jgi:hypothetical protein